MHKKKRDASKDSNNSAAEGRKMLRLGSYERKDEVKKTID
jgi:hypothetical protein